MKKNWKQSISLATLAAAVMLCSMAASAQDTSGGSLVGTWDAVVTIRNCSTGDALNSFASIASFNQGGTTIGSTSGLPQASRTPEHGIWRHLQGRTYEFKFKSFNFVNGVAVGYVVVTHEITLDQGRDTYTSAGTGKVYTMNGIQVAQVCSDAVGTRFDF